MSFFKSAWLKSTQDFSCRFRVDFMSFRVDFMPAQKRIKSMINIRLVCTGSGQPRSARNMAQDGLGRHKNSSKANYDGLGRHQIFQAGMKIKEAAVQEKFSSRHRTFHVFSCLFMSFRVFSCRFRVDFVPVQKVYGHGGKLVHIYFFTWSHILFQEICCFLSYVIKFAD